jgi:hypothetical protein
MQNDEQELTNAGIAGYFTLQGHVVWQECN